MNEIEKIVSIMGDWACKNKMCWNHWHAESLAKVLVEASYQIKSPEPTTAEKLLWLWNNVSFERQSFSTMFHTADITKSDLRLYDDDFDNADGLIAAAYSWAKEQEK